MLLARARTYSDIDFIKSTTWGARHLDDWTGVLGVLEKARFRGGGSGVLAGGGAGRSAHHAISAAPAFIAPTPGQPWPASMRAGPPKYSNVPGTSIRRARRCRAAGDGGHPASSAVSDAERIMPLA